jgi:hypothetical protein
MKNKTEFRPVNAGLFLYALGGNLSKFMELVYSYEADIDSVYSNAVYYNLLDEKYEGMDVLSIAASSPDANPEIVRFIIKFLPTINLPPKSIISNPEIANIVYLADINSPVYTGKHESSLEIQQADRDIFISTLCRYSEAHKWMDYNNLLEIFEDKYKLSHDLLDIAKQCLGANDLD